MVVIKATGAQLQLQAPFHPDLPIVARELRGQWRGKEAGWLFDRQHEMTSRTACRRIWGVDGSAAASHDTVTLQVTVRPTIVGATTWSCDGWASLSARP